MEYIQLEKEEAIGIAYKLKLVQQRFAMVSSAMCGLLLLNDRNKNTDKEDIFITGTMEMISSYMETLEDEQNYKIEEYVDVLRGKKVVPYGK